MRAALAGALALVLAAAAARAAGPLIVNGAGAPLVWTANPVPFNPDRGPLGALDNDAAVAEVAARFATWAAVSTAAIAFTDAGALPTNATQANYATFLGVCNDGLSPIIFDTNGAITDDVFGAGASNSILGFAGPECGTFVPPVITEGVAVLNGKWIDGILSATNRELSQAAFFAVFVHEFGHYVNLDHSQVGLAQAFDGNPANDGAIATMFPFLVNGPAAAVLHLDDAVALSALYPAASFTTGFGTIAGRVLRSDGTTPFQGAWVTARRLGDPLATAVGAASGARFFAGAPGGPPPAALAGAYELPGLPPGDYTVEIEPVDPRFTGGSSVGPFEVPVVLPGPAEFWNGAAEAATDPPDDPDAATPIAVAAGGAVTGIDVVINVPTPPANDDCATPVDVAAVPFADLRSTRFATAAASDPVVSCTGLRNSNTVWYHFTPALDGSVTVDTAGSGYDTVLTAYTGGCGALVEVACNDDTAPGVQARLAFPATGGTTYLIEVADFGQPGGGTLAFALDFTTCGNGVPDPGEDCDAGAANGTDGCCALDCTLLDPDGDGVCDRDDVCPAVADPAQDDGDGDGIGDACDACVTTGAGQTAWFRPRLAVSRIADGRDDNDSLRLTGRFTLATGAFTIDPLTNGASLEVRSGAGVPVLAAVLPPGPFAAGVGWTRGGRTATFRDRRPSGTDGITKLVVRDRGGGVVQVSVTGKKATYAIVPGDAPLAATVVLGGPAAGAAGECGEVDFAALAGCRANRWGTRLTCR